MPEAEVVSIERWSAERGRCARPGCSNPVECWDEHGRLCSACALEHELFDREARWEAVASSVAPSA